MTNQGKNTNRYFIFVHDVKLLIRIILNILVKFPNLKICEIPEKAFESKKFF